MWIILYNALSVSEVSSFVCWFSFLSREMREIADQILIVNHTVAHRGYGLSTFQRKVCKTKFNKESKKTKDQRASDNKLQSLCLWLSPLVNISLCLTNMYLPGPLLFTLFKQPSPEPGQIKQFRPLYLLLLSLSSQLTARSDRLPHSWLCWQNCFS